MTHKKGLAATVGMFTFLSAFLLGPRLLAASIADPMWLSVLVIGAILTVGVLWACSRIVGRDDPMRPTDRS